MLAGPGSGKTRVIVHRCAYLMKVQRVPGRAVLVRCFNRAATRQVRRRLAALVGEEAQGVDIFTYHALALRLVGASFADRLERQGEAGLDDELRTVIRDG